MIDSNFLKALASARELDITFVGSKTGRKYTIPIWFVTDATKISLLPVGGTKSKWYRGILKNPRVELQASGKKTAAEAHSVTDKKQIEKIMDGFRAKYGAGDVKKYYPGQDAAVEL